VPLGGGRTPQTRREWVTYWVLWALAPFVGAFAFGKDGLIVFGIGSALATISGLRQLLVERRGR